MPSGLLTLAAIQKRLGATTPAAAIPRPALGKDTPAAFLPGGSLGTREQRLRALGWDPKNGSFADAAKAVGAAVGIGVAVAAAPVVLPAAGRAVRGAGRGIAKGIKSGVGSVKSQVAAEAQKAFDPASTEAPPTMPVSTAGTYDPQTDETAPAVPTVGGIEVTATRTYVVLGLVGGALLLWAMARR